MAVRGDRTITSDGEMPGSRKSSLELAVLAEERQKVGN